MRLHIDHLTLFGLIAVLLMLLFYAMEQRGVGFVLAFAGACVLGSIYGFLQGAWPFGLVEAIWSLVAFRRWLLALQGTKKNAAAVVHLVPNGAMNPV